MDTCRRPIQPDEEPYLLALGACIRQLREAEGIPQWLLGQGAELSERHIRRLEAGLRRTRRSTLERIAGALTTYERDVPALVEHLCEIAGPALAEESPYRERIEARRRRRLLAQEMERERYRRFLETP